MNTLNNRSVWRRLGAPLTAAMLLASAGIAGAATESASAPEVKSTSETVSVQNITVKDGENLVEVRVIDGEVFIKVNGEQRPTRKLSGDWEKLPITVEGRDKPIATIIRDGKNDRVVVMAGTAERKDIEKAKKNIELRERELAEAKKGVARWNVEVEGLEDLEIEGYRVLEELGEDFFFPAMEELQLELESELGPEALREIELMFGEAARGFPGVAEFRLEGQPKSMIGITMSIESTPDGEVVIIEDVMDGMPASKAGLRSGDRIVEIEKIGLGTEENIRKVTREFEPGQTVKLRVLREGEEVEKTLELAPYKANVFGRIGTAGEAAPRQRFFTIERDAQELAELDAMTERLEAQIAEKRAAIENLAQQMANSGNPEEIAAKIQEVARQLEAQVRKLSEQQIQQRVQRAMVDRLRAQDGSGVIVGRLGDGERPRVFTIPGAPTPPSPPAAPGFRSAPGAEAIAPDPRTVRRIESLEQRLDRLEQSNQRIEEMLQALMRQMSQPG
ncbi:MAG: PDZ domain-containing protein [bacterium]|nr:PDZ domain-containing protein [bacterium]